MNQLPVNEPMTRQKVPPACLSGADTTINRTDSDLTTEVIDEGESVLGGRLFIERASHLALILLTPHLFLYRTLRLPHLSPFK